LFWDNVHFKLLRFLSGKKVFAQVVILSLIDWLRLILLPDPGWETVDRITSTEVLLMRLAVFNLDSLQGLSRWFRIAAAFFFMLGNIWSIFQAYFLNEAQIIFVINSTNTAITTSAVQASVGTSIVTLTTMMIITIWQDKDFQYSALYRSYLPKLAVETAGVEPGSEEMHLILAERDAAAAGWRGWPFKSAVAILVSLVVYFSSVLLSTTGVLMHGADGKESVTMVVLRVFAVLLGIAGSVALFSGNVSRRRMNYTLSSVEGSLWMFYTLVFALAGLASPDVDSPVASVLGTVYTALVLIMWMSLESVNRISRLTHTTITFTIAVGIALGIYLSAFVWQDDTVLADLNGAGVAGVLTRFTVFRTCFINMLLLMAGSLVTVVKKNLSDNSYFVLISGNVLRRDIMEVESLGADPDGDNDFIVDNSLELQLRRHRRSVGVGPASASRVEMCVNTLNVSP
jgi:hypothetical protein